jgi:hypothetical protein
MARSKTGKEEPKVDPATRRHSARVQLGADAGKRRQRRSALSPDATIIGVNDGSTDGSGQLLKTVADEPSSSSRIEGRALRCAPHSTLQEGSRRRAYHRFRWTTRSGIRAGDRRRSIACRHSHRHARSHWKGVPNRRIANMISSAATRAVSGGKVRDSQSGYRAMKVGSAAQSHAVGDRYEFETDFIIRAARAGLLPSTFQSPPFTDRRATSRFRDAWLVIKVLWRHRAGIFRR